MTDTVEQPQIDAATQLALRAHLEEERQHLLVQLGLPDEAVDPEDPTLGHDAVTTTLDTMARETLAHVDAALARLADGTYGSCLDCGAAVPVERLEVMPAARFCVACQQRNE